MIKRISQDETFPLRSRVLRKGAPFTECILPTDNVLGTYHLGYFLDDRLVCIGTFFPEDYPELGKGGMRLRGMATDPEFAGRGYGAELINFAIAELKENHAVYIWCNARSTAAGFYKKLGFKMISEEFEIPGVGPHFNMLYSLSKNEDAVL